MLDRIKGDASVALRSWLARFLPKRRSEDKVVTRETSPLSCKTSGLPGRLEWLGRGFVVADRMQEETMLRIIKIGTNVMTNTDGTLDKAYIAGLVGEVTELMGRGEQVVIVTSGAGGAGRSTTKLRKRHDAVVVKQLFASIGQPLLMAEYIHAFAVRDIVCAQVLATKDDFEGESLEHLLGCIRGLLAEGIVPIVNENDVVAIQELMFTDNDELTSLLARAARADRIVILTTPEGVLDREGKAIPEVTDENADWVLSCIGEGATHNGRGGMRRKFEYARAAAAAGIEVVVARGRTENAITRIANGERLGTRFEPKLR